MKLKIFILPIFLFCLSIDIQAQKTSRIELPVSQPCTLKLQDAPKFRGIHLEMTETEIKNEYPAMVFTEDFPEGSVDKNALAGIVRKSQIANSKYKENIEQISVMFSKENRVLTALFIFENSNYGANLEELSKNFSEFLNLPTTYWKPARGDNKSLSIYCNDFAVNIGFTEDQKPSLFMAKAPNKLTKSDKEILKPSN